MQPDCDEATIETILDGFREALGRDFVAYRNHCHRVAALCRAFVGEAAYHPEKTAIATAFHDLGIWTAHTWDYLAPSVELARSYLSNHGRDHWFDEIAESIERHHKLTPAFARPPLVEALRRADLADVSFGLLRSGLAASSVGAIRDAHPDAGFHLRLIQLGCAHAVRNPLRPLPMLRW